MKNISLIVFLSLIGTTQVFAVGSHRERGYVKHNGAYVAPHRQTNPNRTQRDNWSSAPNTNPYTGKQGTKTSRY